MCPGGGTEAAVHEPENERPLPGAGTESPKERRPCRRCRYFFITHEPGFPYGCRAMGFKSARYPAAVVQQASGLACQRYSPRKEALS